MIAMVLAGDGPRPACIDCGETAAHRFWSALLAGTRADRLGMDWALASIGPLTAFSGMAVLAGKHETHPPGPS